METKFSFNLKSETLLRKKMYLNLLSNILIAFLGISSLFIKFFIADGKVDFRAFTVDGNLFTTVVCIVAIVINIKEIADKKDYSGRKLFFFELAAVVTEAVIFIMVMIGSLPIFDDNPKITPYHMFCLHVAIPVLTVARFIFFEKPIGFLKPAMLLRGSIPIGVYGIGIIIALKTGLLPMSLVPYSFLNFEANFLWYFLFALVVIPSFGYLWSWLFYRLNIRASVLWYDKEDIEKLNNERIKSLYRFDVVKSGILLIYTAFAIIVLMFALMGSSRTTTKVQYESMENTGFYIFEDFHYRLGNKYWELRDGALYKGDIFIGDGTEENFHKNLIDENLIMFESSIFVSSSALSPNVVKNASPYDFVCVHHTSGKNGPVNKCGDILNRNVVTSVLYGDNDGIYYTEEKIGKTKYFHFYMSFGKTMEDSGVGIISMYMPVSKFVIQAKNAEFHNDIMMIFVVCIIFTVIYLITIKWIKVLEQSLLFVKDIANDNIPEKPISLGSSKRLSGLEKELNAIREKKKQKVEF